MCGDRYTCHSTEVQTTCGSLVSASTMKVSKIKIRSVGLASALFAQLCHTHDFLYFYHQNLFLFHLCSLCYIHFFISYNYINIGLVLFNFTRPQKMTQRYSKVYYDLPSLLDLHWVSPEPITMLRNIVLASNRRTTHLNTHKKALDMVVKFIIPTYGKLRQGTKPVWAL